MRLRSHVSAHAATYMAGAHGVTYRIGAWPSADVVPRRLESR
jgi:hypothetical protein